MTLLRGGPRKLIALLLVSLVVFVAIHQLSYLADLDLASHLSKSLEIVNKCPPRSAPEPSGDKPSAEAGPGIPKIIHQIWKTNDVRTYPIEASHDSWKAMFEPMNYTVKLWAEEDIVGLITAKYPWLLATYQGYPQNIQRADVARLVVIHAEGGIYADLDVHPMSFQEISCWRQLELQALFASTSGTRGISNHFIMAEKGAPFLRWALHEAKQRGGGASRRILFPYFQVFWSTGPLMVNTAYRQYASASGEADAAVGLLEEIYGGNFIWHATGRSWQKTDGRVLNYVSDHVEAKSLWMAIIMFFAILGFAGIMARRCGRRSLSSAGTTVL